MNSDTTACLRRIRNLSRFFIVVASVSLLSGCSTSNVLPPFPYTTSNKVIGSGAIEVRDVTYILAESGQLTPSQVYHSNSRAVVKMSEPVADYVREALTAELQRSGFSSGGGTSFQLSCKIIRLGVSVLPMGADAIFAGELSLARSDGTSVSKMAFDLSRNRTIGTSMPPIRKNWDSMIAEACDRFMDSPTVKAALSTR
jgi:hypothetical protein